MAGSQNARPSCVALEKDFRKLMNHKIGDSILGKVRQRILKKSVKTKQYGIGRWYKLPGYIISFLNSSK